MKDWSGYYCFQVGMGRTKSSSKVYIYVISEDKWMPMSTMERARSNHGCASVKKAHGVQEVIVFGGTDGQHQTVEIYDLDRNRWR